MACWISPLLAWATARLAWNMATRFKLNCPAEFLERFTIIVPVSVDTAVNVVRSGVPRVELERLGDVVEDVGRLRVEPVRFAQVLQGLGDRAAFQRAETPAVEERGRL